MSSIKSNPESPNFESKTMDVDKVTKIFISYANSYYGKFIVKKLKDSSKNGSENKIFGTLQENQAVQQIDVEYWKLKCENFLTDVSKCDIIILDISQDKLQLQESKIIVDYLENLLENGTKLNLKLILISTILTWARTEQNDEIMTDSNYRKRRPHPCFNDHLLLERKVMNLQKKFVDSVQSILVCPGIIYGEEQDIFHYIFKQCYFNHPYVDVFMPAINYLPIIYIHDFVNIVVNLLIDFPNITSNYILVVQPYPLNAFDITRIFAQSMSGNEVMVRICEKEDILSMGIDEITEITCNYLMLNLRLESDNLKDFEFTINRLNLKDHAEKITQEFYNSRKLKPIKILIDGSPHTYQAKLGKLLSQFYCIHPIDHKCFLKFYQCRLALKVHYIEKYLSYMEEMSHKCTEEVLSSIKYQELISSHEDLLEKLKQENAKVDKFLMSKNHTFDDICEFLIEKLSCYGCSKHQGYVMSNFQLNKITASKIFLDDKNEKFIEAIKPDYVIVIERSLELCEKEKIEKELSDVEKDLKDYYDRNNEEVSILNFFLDRGIFPIEILIKHDLTDTEIHQEIFELLKLKIGHSRTYQLSKDEQEEMNKIKELIANKEAAEREEMDRKRAEKELDDRQKKFEESSKQVMNEKVKEFHKLEQQSLPVRQYLMKNVLPHVTDAIVDVCKVRPENPAQFLGNYLLNSKSSFLDSEIDQKVMDEFKKLSKCDP